jgi:2-hydroxy-3-keto-5-methylthiopentenyl-1-phosphate phosphatase
VWERTEAALAERTLTLNEVLVRQLATVRATPAEALDFMGAHVSLRPGLVELIAFCRERFIEPVVLSSGFHELIEPILAGHDIALPTVAHRVTFSPAGATIAFLERTPCGECGEECKRADTLRLAAGRQIAYAGDGWSDHCAAEVADVVFARSTLARYLGGRGVAFQPFGDLFDVRDGLDRYLAAR